MMMIGNRPRTHTQTGDVRIKPYTNWIDFGQALRSLSLSSFLSRPFSLTLSLSLFPLPPPPPTLPPHPSLFTYISPTETQNRW